MSSSKCNHPLYWHGCYQGTYDLITPESMAHPAKMSAGLCFRILDHLKELGLLKDSDTILDPMGGTGTTAITAGAKGYRAITVELEEKFVKFQQDNKDYAARKLYRPLDWRIIQGDARNLGELLNEQGLVTVSSPPYQDSRVGQEAGKGKDITDRRAERLREAGYDPKKILTPGRRAHGNLGALEHYSNNPSNIGNQNENSYLEAMKAVYSEIAKVSDVLAIVLKNPTKGGKLRRLDLDTIEILKQSGWTIHCQHRALLFEELEQADMFNGSQKKVKGRMSFFKRLSWQAGQPVASWEDVIICTRGS